MKRSIVAVSAAVLASSAWAEARTLTMDFNYIFSGTYAPSASTPWLRATFDDFGASGSVKLTFEAVNMTSPEYASELFFNLDPLINPTSVAFSLPTKTGAFVDPGIHQGTNLYKADGDGHYDFVLDFDTSGNDTHRFGAGDKVEYTLTLAGLTANSFSFLSTEADGTSHNNMKYYPAASHIQAIPPPGDSAWVAPGIVPLPTAVWMGMALMGSVGGFGYIRRRRNLNHQPF